MPFTAASVRSPTRRATQGRSFATTWSARPITARGTIHSKGAAVGEQQQDGDHGRCGKQQGHVRTVEGGGDVATEGGATGDLRGQAGRKLRGSRGLGRSELNAIMWIAEGTRNGEPVTAGGLSVRLGLGAPATTALIDRLEATGHVVRVRNQRDRRRVTVRMQDEAIRLAGEFFRPLGQRMSEAVAGVPTGDLRRAAEIVERLRDAVALSQQGVHPGGSRSRSALVQPKSSETVS